MVELDSTTGSVATLDAFEIVGLPVGSGGPSPLATDDTLEWIPACAPGGVHTALLEAGRIDDPYSGANERAAEWVEKLEWWYRARFDANVPAGTTRTRLVFDGLDTVVDIWLNGRRLGHHENQFRAVEYDVTEVLAEENVLLLRFRPPIEGLTTPDSSTRMVRRMQLLRKLTRSSDTGDPLGAMTALQYATARRKAAMSWGWDFGPNLPAIGIWRPVRLVHDRSATIRSYRVVLDELAEDHRSGRIRVDVEIETLAARTHTAEVRLTSPTGRVLTTHLPFPAGRGTGTAQVSLPVVDPELWWTHDLGDPTLHTVDIVLRAEDEPVHTVQGRVGLRTIALDQGIDAEEGGRRFRFLLNGVPVFARGGNWLAPHMLTGGITADTYRDLVGLARDGNLTMLRVWGGGIYEHDAFYDVCDELGVLVWQDFMFACISYPSADARLQAEVRAEAEYQVRRLRNHACLALWCGNNEVEWLHGMIFWTRRKGNWGHHFFHDILPTTVAEHDGVVPYWPGSPFGGGGPFGTNGSRDGDRHNWEVWHGAGARVGSKRYPTHGDARHYRRYAYDRGKFISEFGIHASPELSTLQRWLPTDALVVHSEIFDLHNKDHPKDKGDELLAVTTGLPQDLGEYIAFTQAVQAEGMAFAVEHYRRRQPHTSGALVWSFNDVWPAFSWSLVDFDRVPKAAYYAVARASTPIALSFRDREDGGLELWLVNNTRDTVDLAAEVELGRFDGTARRTISANGTAGSATSVPIWTGDASQVERSPEHYAWATGPGGLRARHYFTEIGRLRTGSSRLLVNRERTAPGTVTLWIESVGFSYFVHASSPVPGMRFNDNYFDLRDRDRVEVTVTGVPDDLDLEAITVASYPWPGERRTVDHAAGSEAQR
ncbi:glycoside hydrolase family 2 protein [Kibdelosporangium aridum]|uniref:glycoside hydrolase family 2 protein n=1 Tax=Kibdelosporangium aridum TaxID=2030 RepID=UPI00068B55BC